MTATARRRKGSATPAPLSAGVAEHRWRWEHQERSRRAVVGPRIVETFSRVVCSCGWASRWSRKITPTRRAAELHAHDGQLSIDWR